MLLPCCAPQLLPLRPHPLAPSHVQVCPLSQLEPECLMAVVRHLAEPPLAPWLFKQPWIEVIPPDVDAIYQSEPDDYMGDEWGCCC